MRIDVKSIILVFLMLALSLSVATNSLNGEVETATLEEIAEPLNVILPIADLNVPGFQEGSIFTDTTLSGGGYHTCIILEDGSVSCWGYNYNGQIGDGTTTDRTTRTQTSSFGIGRTAVAISSGDVHTCAILDDGTVSCWGYNYYGQLGDGTTTSQNTPVQTSSLGTGRTAVAISSGFYHTCAILDDGSVSCWGAGGSGQLGDGTTSSSLAPTQTSSLGTGRTAVAISSGFYHTCAILDDGSVSCWGPNNNGKLGDGTNIGRNTPTQTSSLGTGRTAVAISSGQDHTCAILDDGSVNCWGRNVYKQLGDGTSTDRNTPTPTSSLGTGRTAVALSSGSAHTCAILDDGTVNCWGWSLSGRLGNGTTDDLASPTQTSSLGTNRTAVAISSGSEHTCALLDDGTVSCWGYNYYGQLGDGTTTSRNTPTQTWSFGSNQMSALSERDFDADGVLNIFESTSPTVVSCNAGQYGRYICVYAPVGKFVSSNSAMYATDCAVGTYQATTGQSSCDDADAGYYVSATAQSSQTACQSGKYNPDNGSTSDGDCKWADRGHYVNASLGPGQFSQTACPIGTYSPFDTATSQDTCLLAIPGTFANQTGLEMLYFCPTGTYQPESGKQSCISADPGHRPQKENGWATSQVPCSPGQYQPLSGQFDCLNTDVGHFTNQTGSIAQIPCSSGTYQADAGRLDCISANPGYHVDSEGQSSQSLCLAGTYQPLSGQNFCFSAEIGHYVNSSLVDGALINLNQTECPKGTFQRLSIQSSCFDADPGYYVDLIGQSHQMPCPRGTYQPEIGQQFCIFADAGTYVDKPGQTFVVGCPTGTYNPSAGAVVQCLDSTEGNYVALKGQDSQTPCEIGTFQNQTRMISCDDALIGHYVSVTGSGNQTACPNYTSTLISGSDSIADCLLDTDLDSIPNMIDYDDDNDGTIDELDAFPLDDSENSDTDGNGVGDNLQTKQEAKFQTQMLKIGGIVILLIVIGALIFFKRKNSVPESIKEIPVMESNVMGTTAIDVETPLTHPSHLQNELEPLATPNAATPADQVDANGYEWLTHSDGTKWYRVAQSNSEWIKFE